MAELEATDREAIADWIEVTMLARGGALGFDALHGFAADELHVNEAQVGLALKVLSRRSQLLGSSYPFQVHDVAVSARPDARSCPYSLLVLLSPGSPARQLLHRQPTDEMVLVFERLVAKAMRSLFGGPAKAVRFGWPSEEGRPAEFHLAIEWLAGKMGIAPGRSYRPPRRKDGGVDVVAWRPFPDGKSGFPVVLVQCTLQQDLVPKSADIDVRNWAGWLTLDADPTTALAIPGTIANTETWNEIAVRCLILDRVRLTSLLPDTPLSDIEGAEALVADQFSELCELLMGAEK